MIMRKILFILFCLTPFLFVAQSKKLWLKQADDFFAKKDYASALQYYKKVLDDSVVFTETVKPYEIQLTNLKTKDYKDTAAVAKGTATTINKHHYVVHQMAVCYFNIHDYENEIVQLKKSVSLGSYPNDRYFYEKSLMNTKR